MGIQGHTILSGHLPSAVKIYKSTWYHEPEHSYASARSRNAWAYWPLPISLKVIRRGYPQYVVWATIQVPWSWRLRRRTGVGSLEVNNQLFALIWVHLRIFVSQLLLYCCMLQRFGLLKACIYKSHYGYYGAQWPYRLSRTYEQKQVKLWKNIWGPTFRRNVS